MSTITDFWKFIQGKLMGGKTIEVTAYAIQKDGFSSAEAAWNATFASKS